MSMTLRLIDADVFWLGTIFGLAQLHYSRLTPGGQPRYDRVRNGYVPPSQGSFDPLVAGALTTAYALSHRWGAVFAKAATERFGAYRGMDPEAMSGRLKTPLFSPVHVDAVLLDQREVAIIIAAGTVQRYSLTDPLSVRTLFATPNTETTNALSRVAVVTLMLNEVRNAAWLADRSQVAVAEMRRALARPL